jgi:hypothetical protein
MAKGEGDESKVDERRFYPFGQKHIFAFKYVDMFYITGVSPSNRNQRVSFGLNFGGKTVLAGCAAKEKLGFVRVLLHVSE